MAGKRVERVCAYSKCQNVHYPRLADVKRGWGRFCSKSCKAMEQEGRTGQYAAYVRSIDGGDDDLHFGGGPWDEHKDYR